MPIEPVVIDVAVLRPGRTIELVEARISHGGRPAIVLRAWLAQAYDSGGMAAVNFPSLPPPQPVPACDLSLLWPGGFLPSLAVRRDGQWPGRPRRWARSPPPLTEGAKVLAGAG